jgi:hypothetical protein
MAGSCVGNAGENQARYQGAGRPVPQPANPVVGRIRVALTDRGTYWTLVPGGLSQHLPFPLHAGPGGHRPEGGAPDT